MIIAQRPNVAPPGGAPEPAVRDDRSWEGATAYLKSMIAAERKQLASDLKKFHPVSPAINGAIAAVLGWLVSLVFTGAWWPSFLIFFYLSFEGHEGRIVWAVLCVALVGALYFLGYPGVAFWVVIYTGFWAVRSGLAGWKTGYYLPKTRHRPIPERVITAIQLTVLAVAAWYLAGAAGYF